MSDNKEYDKLDLLRLMCRWKNLWKAVFTENDEIKRVLFPHVCRSNIPQSYISDLFLFSGFLLNSNSIRKP